MATISENIQYDTIDDVFFEYENSDENEKQKYIIVTGGIGDFISLDYIHNYCVHNNIIFISSQSLTIKKLLINILKLTSSNLKNKYYAIYFDFKSINKPGFDNTHELYKYMPTIKKYNLKIINISDYFIKIRHNIKYIRHYKNILNNNIILNNPIIHDIKTKFNLPNNIAFISPFTEDNRINCIKCNKIHTYKNNGGCMLTRNFVNTDYTSAARFLKENNLIGVIISLTHIFINERTSESNLFINLSTKTTLLESIEILKVSKYYIGIDNLFSVVSSKILDPNNIFIKSNNLHLYKNKDIYYLPNNLNPTSFITF
jgi:hypothetical protein